MVAFKSLTAWLLAASARLVLAAPSASLDFKIDKRYVEVRDDVTYNVFEHAATGTKMSFVNNSGICETTPGVNQYSGYLSVGTNMNMWFWFFEARNNASTAPLATWFNGGPGCSSMIGLFQENGPCQFYNGASTPSLNPYSFNEYANMIYVDQPIGTGFSYGTDTVTSTVTAAPFVWKLLQAFLTQFPQYESRDFGIFTESYGGHYGPEFASYIETQNSAIASGSLQGEKINLVALGINNGLYDETIQYKADIDFAYNNTYRKLITAAQQTSLNKVYTSKCLPLLNKCTGLTGADASCEQAYNTCSEDIDDVIYNSADFDPYDVRASSNDPNPPETYATYLARADVVKAIGAQSTYQECPNSVNQKFFTTGDYPRSLVSTLSTVIQSGIRVLTWAGDADFICNWFGNLDVANALTYSGSAQFSAKTLAPYTVGGTELGQFKSVDNLSFIRVYGAGHEVPYYSPKLALQAFTQTMKGQAVSST
ncbi:Alpha/Beta hydrolase protein [Truncatella angustata]|uniref:Carboxypeptidase n=1 Tax=Truncatella angustata TaxID=152316 RepID=A0A9P8RP71_9PEZI|nr:Alpha/Beta hydrolase protein [Truncatella angustata]KAH6647100.1 Alpha/Beta hydrolase protein [Truncatella angustata]